ncbi:GNAT family N-acetyltransferase [Companilactobacillus keshanensis]|uniref:GNAT family N-acetyltransferase n=1 Tax=Companilactobacillus keshanensis TaxID=2486003 RepID=A0ABW4BV43_9LACO|nr:GNAT family N-acetyltransferase [Companilactobacillus keshanensis]
MIREAKISDIKDIAKINIASWQTTYAGIIDREFLRDLSFKETTERWNKHFLNNRNKIFVAEAHGKIVGYVRSERIDDKDFLGAIYLLDDYQGKGLGKQLLMQGLDYLKPSKMIYVHVLEANKTKYFYQKYGAELYKKSKIKIGRQILSELTFIWNFE